MSLEVRPSGKETGHGQEPCLSELLSGRQRQTRPRLKTPNAAARWISTSSPGAGSPSIVQTAYWPLPPTDGAFATSRLCTTSAATVTSRQESPALPLTVNTSAGGDPSPVFT